MYWLFEQVFKVVMYIWCIDNMFEGSCWVLEQDLFVMLAMRASMSYPPTFQYLSFRTANVFDVQSMLFSAFVSKSFIIFLCCYGIQAFPKAQKYEWLTHQIIYANSIFCFCFLVFFSNSPLLIEVVVGVYFMCLFAQIFKTNLCYTYIVFSIRI